MRISLRGICLTIAMVSVIAGVGNFIQHRDDRAFASHGQHATATPTRVERVTRTKHGQTTSITYYADLRYKTASGDTATATKLVVPDDLIQAVGSGLPVEIDYLPERTSTVRFQGWVPTKSADTGYAILVFLAAVAALRFLPKSD